MHRDGHLRVSLVKLHATKQCHHTHNIGTEPHVGHNCYHGYNYNLLIFCSLQWMYFRCFVNKCFVVVVLFVPCLNVIVLLLNFELYGNLARSANLPEGLYIYHCNEVW